MTAFANFRAASLAAALALMPACSTCHPQLLGTQADLVQGAIHAAWREHAEAAKARDAQGLVQIYADDAVYAATYLEGAAITKGTAAELAKAIERAADVESITLFTDGEGDLWLAVTRENDGAFIELRRKP